MIFSKALIKLGFKVAILDPTGIPRQGTCYIGDNGISSFENHVDAVNDIKTGGRWVNEIFKSIRANETRKEG